MIPNSNNIYKKLILKCRSFFEFLLINFGLSKKCQFERNFKKQLIAMQQFQTLATHLSKCYLKNIFFLINNSVKMAFVFFYNADV
jgi:hypothetical protein